MSKNKLLKCSLAVALVFGSVGALAGCNKDSDSGNKDVQYNIYQMAVGAGYSGTYEEWLSTISGDKGVGGTTWISGIVAPSNDIGKNGDFYFDSVTKKIYNKVNNVWGMIANITDGNGIVNVSKSSESGVDTYTITYTDGTSYSFSVTNGKEVEFRVSDGNVQWSYKNSNNWNNLIGIDSLKGDAGKNPIIEVVDGSIVWKYEGESSWRELFDLSSIKGDPGSKWHSGTVVPNNEDGADGDFYFNSVAKSVYRKINGFWELLSVIEDGTDGTIWGVGEGVPSSNANLGDFYFDKLNNDIYLYTEQGWSLQISLYEEIKETEFSLKDGIYKGIFNEEYEFEMSILNENISSFKINGTPSNVNFNSYYRIVDNDKVKINARIRGDSGFIVLEETFCLRENRRLVKYINEDEVDLLKGVYYDDNEVPLTLSSNKFAYSYDGKDYVGDWEVIEHFNTSGTSRYLLLLDGGNEKFEVTVSYINRTYNVSSVICNFYSKSYDYKGENVGFVKTGLKSFIRHEDMTTVEVNSFSFDDASEYLYLENIDEGISLVLDYFSGTVIESEVSNNYIIGKTVTFDKANNTYTYYFDAATNELKFFDDSVSIQFEDYMVEFNISTGEVKVYSVDDSIIAILMTFNYTDINWENEQKGIYENDGKSLSFEIDSVRRLTSISVETIA